MYEFELMKIENIFPRFILRSLQLFLKKAYNEIYAIISCRNRSKTVKGNLCKIVLSTENANIYRQTYLDLQFCKENKWNIDKKE